MRQVLRVFTIVSFAVFLVTAILAFSVRPASAAGTQPVDAGSTDAGPPRSASPTAPIGNVFGGSGDREYLAGSKAFGASVAPEGFGGLGLRGGGSGEGLGMRGGVGFPRPEVIDCVVRGPLPVDSVRKVAASVAGGRLGEEPCVARPAVFVVEFVVTPAGRVTTSRAVSIDGGVVPGADCVAERMSRTSWPKAAGPSTVRITWQVSDRSRP